MSRDVERRIATFPEWNSRHEELRISRGVYRGIERVDVRLYYADPDDGPELKPSKAGLAIPVGEKLNDLIAALSLAASMKPKGAKESGK